MPSPTWPDRNKKQAGARHATPVRTRSNFSKSVMVSVGVSALGCSKLIFTEPGVKINGAYYRNVRAVSICYLPFVAYQANSSHSNRTTLLPTVPVTLLLVENGFWREIGTQVIHFAINYRQTRASISPCNIAGLISDTYRRKLPSSTTPLLFDAPAKRNPREYPHKPYISRNQIHRPTFLSLTVWIYLHSHLFSGLDASFLRQSAFWPFKVIQGHSRSSILIPIESACMTSY